MVETMQYMIYYINLKKSHQKYVKHAVKKVNLDIFMDGCQLYVISTIRNV